METTKATLRFASAVLFLTLGSLANGSQLALDAGPPAAHADAWQGGPRAGTSMVFYASSASLIGSYGQLAPDAFGRWRNALGQTFHPEDSASASGHGFTVVDVVHRDARVCVGRVEAMNIDPITNALTSFSSDAFVTAADACSDFWSDPDRLRTMPVGLQPTLQVTRGAIEFSGRPFDVLGVRSGPPGAHAYHNYDLSTGFLLFGGSATEGSSVLVPNPDGVTSRRGPGNTLLTHTSLLGVRQLDLPPVTRQLPAHARGARELEYHGVQGMAFGGVVNELPLVQRLERVDGGDGWALLRATRHTGDPRIGFHESASFHAVMAPDHIGGNFLTPALLVALARDRWIDRDPVTGAQTAVARADDRVVTIERRTNAEVTAWTYDLATGWLLEAYREQALGEGAVYVRLTLRSVD